MHTVPADGRRLSTRHKTQRFTQYVIRLMQFLIFTDQPLDRLLRCLALLHAPYLTFLQPFFPPPVVHGFC